MRPMLFASLTLIQQADEAHSVFFSLLVLNPQSDPPLRGFKSEI